MGVQEKMGTKKHTPPAIPFMKKKKKIFFSVENFSAGEVCFFVPIFSWTLKSLKIKKNENTMKFIHLFFIFLLLLGFIIDFAITYLLFEEITPRKLCDHFDFCPLLHVREDL